MRYKYNLPTLEHITNDLTQLTGVAITVLDRHQECLIPSSCQNDYCTALQTSNANLELCQCSDQNLLKKCTISRKLEKHICHAGLCDAAMPIVSDNTILGYIVFGRIRSLHSPCISKYALDTINGESLDSLYQKLPFYTEEQLNCLYDLFTHILFEKAIEIETDDFIEMATSYIDEHLCQHLSIDSLCLDLNVSRNYLYRSFHKHYGQTVNDYITKKKIKKSKKLLEQTQDSIIMIAEKVGYENYTYFCKLFKKETGMSPAKYRASKKEGVPKV